jgi:hypothetical protein
LAQGQARLHKGRHAGERCASTPNVNPERSSKAFSSSRGNQDNARPRLSLYPPQFDEASPHRRTKPAAKVRLLFCPIAACKCVRFASANDFLNIEILKELSSSFAQLDR